MLPRRTKVLIACALLFSTGIALPVSAIEQGAVCPDFKLNSNSGEPVTLSQFRGKIVFIDFWNSWCKTCRRSLGWIQGVQRKLPTNSFEIIAINLDDSPNDAQEVLKKDNLNLLVAYDPLGSTPEAFNIESTPTSIIIAPDGTVVQMHSGFDDETAAAMERQILDLVYQAKEPI